MDRVWEGAVAVAVGGGPSLTQGQVDQVFCKAKVIAVNDAYRMAPWADLLYFADEKWFRWHAADVLAMTCMKVTIKNEKLKSEIPGLVCMRHDGREGLCTDPDGLRTGRNSGYQAINLAVHLGVRRLILLGYDMKRSVSGLVHWFGEHPVPNHPERFEDHAKDFPMLVAPLKRAGMEVVNCTPGSRLDCFPKMSLAEALA